MAGVKYVAKRVVWHTAEHLRSVRGIQRTRELTALLLVRGVTPSAAPKTTTTIAATRREAAAPETSASEAPTTATAAHPGDIGSLGGDFDVATFEQALVEHQRLGNQTRFRKLDVGVSEKQTRSAKGPIHQSVGRQVLPLRLAGELVQKNRHSVDGAATLEVSLDLLRRC